MPSHQERVRQNYCEHTYQSKDFDTCWTCCKCKKTRPLSDSDEYACNLEKMVVDLIMT